MPSLPWDAYVACIYTVLFNATIPWKLGRLVEQRPPKCKFSAVIFIGFHKTAECNLLPLIAQRSV